MPVRLRISPNFAKCVTTFETDCSSTPNETDSVCLCDSLQRQKAFVKTELGEHRRREFKVIMNGWTGEAFKGSDGDITRAMSSDGTSCLWLTMTAIAASDGLQVQVWLQQDDYRGQVRTCRGWRGDNLHKKRRKMNQWRRWKTWTIYSVPTRRFGFELLWLKSNITTNN